MLSAVGLGMCTLLMRSIIAVECLGLLVNSSAMNVIPSFNSCHCIDLILALCSTRALFLPTGGGMAKDRTVAILATL